MNQTETPILVLGNGGFGTAIAMILHSAGHDVRVWGFETDYTPEIQATRRNPRFLPGVEIPDGILFDSDVSVLTPGVRTMVSVIPTQFVRRTMERLKNGLPEDPLIVSCSKGFERETGALPSRLVREVFPKARIGVLSGPSHAEEVARNMATTVVVASEDREVARSLQRLFSTRSFRSYTSTDPLGVEIAGACKNVIALAAGISDGLGFGDNARAALVCRGAREMIRLGITLGAQAETFWGLSGIGDLVATCTSRHSRNHAVGERIGKGESLDSILASTDTVAEGVETTQSLHRLATELSVELPITNEVHHVLFQGKPPHQAVVDLMQRAPKDETDDSPD